MPEVSLFASAVRYPLFNEVLNSMIDTTISCEIVFCGDSPYIKRDLDTKNNGIVPDFKYIKTGHIKPAQCYEIARRHCTGECVMWIADDAEFPNNVVGKAYKYWKGQNNEKLILSIQTRETGYRNINGFLFPMDVHRFYGGNPRTPLMAPLCLMSRKFLDDLGGLDKRYVCGQYENDIVMRAYTQGATVEIFGGIDCYIDIDHLSKSILCGECTNDDNFRQRPFATGYEKDREILENSWVIKDQYGRPISISPKQLDEFQPYPAEISLNKSEEPKGKWE